MGRTPEGRATTARERPPKDVVADRRARAMEEPLVPRLLNRRVYPLLEVRNPAHRTLYLVMLPEFPDEVSAICTCADFARRGLGTCKHVAAAVRWLKANPDAPETGPKTEPPLRPAEVWQEIDRRLSETRREDGADVRVLARPGAALYS